MPFPAPVDELGLAIRVRSTLIVSSLQSLRRRGREDSYLQHLPPEHHGIVRSLIAGHWLPMALAEAHYDACEALAFDRQEILAIGREVGDRIEGSFLATMVRMAGNVGATPWTALAQVGRLYDRLFEGGGVSVLRRGPKDARVLFAGMPLARVPYFRSAIAGVLEVGLQLFCTRAYAQIAPQPGPQTAVVFELAWA